MPTSGTGVATLTFPASPHAAQFRSSVVVEDSAPNPNVWMTSNLPATNNHGMVGAGPGIFVACNSNAAASSYSYDGVKWEPIALIIVATSMAYGNGTFVAVHDIGSNGNTYTSTNGGTAWAYNGNALPSTQFWSGVAFGNGVFVAVSRNVSSVSATSTDGVAWTTRAMPAAGEWYVFFGNGLFVAVNGGTTTVATSSDGVTWSSSAALPSAQSWNSVCFGTGVFVAGSLGGVSTSSDGVTWSGLNAQAGSSPRCIAFGGGRFVSALSSLSYISRDAVSWQAISLAPLSSASGVCYGTDKFLLGNGGSAISVLRDNTRTLTTINTETQPAKPVPGSNIATVTVTGLPDITATSSASAFIDGDDTTADRNAYEHEKADIRLSCDNFVAGVGFTITATSDVRLDGDVKVRYVWRA